MLIKKIYNLITSEKNINTRAVYFTYSLFLKKNFFKSMPKKPKQKFHRSCSEICCRTSTKK
jgi:hypothetical protein